LICAVRCKDKWSVLSHCSADSTSVSCRQANLGCIFHISARQCSRTSRM